MNNLKSRKGGASLRNLKRLLCLLLVLTMLPINAFASDIIVPGSGGTSPGSGGGGSGTKWSSPTNLGPGMLLHVQQGGEQGRSRSMQFPAAGYLHFGDWSPWELRRSHALRGIGRRTRDQSTTRGARAQRPSARSCEGIKRQGADFLSRSPVLLSPLARLPVPSCCFLIGCRQKPRASFVCLKVLRPFAVFDVELSPAQGDVQSGGPGGRGAGGPGGVPQQGVHTEYR